jgi:hypothetical protein
MVVKKRKPSSTPSRERGDRPFFVEMTDVFCAVKYGSIAQYLSEKAKAW